jgi:hypothetical protein
MPPEVKYDRSHHAGATPEARIANRLRNSGDTAHADHSVVHGTGPTRTHSQIHYSRQQKYGADNPGEGGIRGSKRSSV